MNDVTTLSDGKHWPNASSKSGSSLIVAKKSWKDIWNSEKKLNLDVKDIYLTVYQPMNLSILIHIEFAQRNLD